MASLIQENEILDLVKIGHRWIDVRAPIEFSQGTLPNAVNLPLLDDDERNQVGTCYKKEGRDKAVMLGHRLVSESNKERKIQDWIRELKKHDSVSLFCYRGGLRSQISQQWLGESGCLVRRVAGGYKQMRSVMTRYFCQQVVNSQVNVISGPTGAWKTHLIQWLKKENHLALDLEKHAAHRGSAFGKLGTQPQQVNFEHTLVKEILDLESFFQDKKTLYLEDESRLIGKCVLPDFLFEKMRSSPILWVDEPLEVRVENIFFDYVKETDIGQSHDEDKVRSVYLGYLNAVNDIKKRLGFEKFTEIYKDIQFSREQSLCKNDHDSNRIWIRKLLSFYYDPLYFSSLERRSPVTLIKGNTNEIKSFISQ